MPFAPFVILWGPDASSDRLRRALRCTRCGAKGGGLYHPSFADIQIGEQPFPSEQEDITAMCGRVRLSTDYSEIKIKLRLDPQFPAPNFPPRWNVPPTSQMFVVMRDPDTGTRRPVMMRWGLVPAWAKDLKSASYSTFNARADGIETKPAFRAAWQAGRRCLVVTDGFYEWRKGDKQPFAIGCAEGPLTVMAGLYEHWTSPAAETVASCTIITTDANDAMAPLHDRMPVILAESDWPVWLGETQASPDEVRALLRPYPADKMHLWPVDRRVGNVKNDGAELVEPVPLPA